MADQVFPTEPVATTPQPAWRSTLNSVVNFILKQREASILVIAIALMAYFQASNSAFLSSANIPVISQYTAATAIIAAGEVMLLICGEIDLSVGNAFALAPFIMYFANQAGVPLFLGIILGLLTCAAIGLINGLVTVFLRVPSFITTLGTLFMLNGITLVISNAFPVLPPDENTPFSQVFGQGPYSEIEWAIAIVIVMQIILYFTPFGLHTVATGGNPLGASEVGVNVNRIKIINFMVCSVFGGFAGILEGFRINTISPLSGGTDIMFAAVAGSVIGGTALNGGSGTVIGAFLGVFVISLLKDGFTLVGVNAYYFNLILGAAILIAMILNVRLQVLRKAGRE
jgi:simple sugar transport system permease protein